MQISLEKLDKQLPKAIKIEGEGQSVSIYPSGVSVGSIKTYQSGINLFLDRSAKNGSSLVGEKLLIVSPGEYEHNGVFISAQINPETAELNVIEIEIEGVRCLYYSSSKDIERGLLTQVGVVDILVLEVQTDFAQQLKALTAIDPQVLIPFSVDPEALAKFKQELGIVFEQESKLKMRALEFQNEEYVIRGIELV